MSNICNRNVAIADIPAEVFEEERNKVGVIGRRRTCPEVAFVKRMEVGNSVRFTYEEKKDFERARATLCQHNSRYKNIEYFTRVKTLSIFVKRIA